MDDIRRPLISILMAVYNPNAEWFKEQLLSLNSQTYPNVRLYVRDDCSPDVSFEKIAGMITECITAFPFTVNRNEQNLGSTLTFERLTQEAQGDLFAYCDQDDVWLPEKLSILSDTMRQKGSLLVCSDMYIIDGAGNKIAHSITEIRRHHIFFSGENLAQGLLTHNFVTGCTMLVDAKTAKAAIPFCPYMVHDHYLALYSAARGRLDSVLTPTIYYRQHGNNQTGLMAGVTDKESYGRVRIDDSVEKFKWLQANFSCGPVLSGDIERRLAWMELRQIHWREKRKGLDLWQYRDCGKAIVLFELLAVHFPERIFAWVIGLNRKNII